MVGGAQGQQEGDAHCVSQPGKVIEEQRIIGCEPAQANPGEVYHKRS